ncbi:hypothetical protein AYR66_17990 [Noviherbaspirillum denitrificans]|uniref:Uncharacterized protein n=1 Tax=Noviherbaspirillum denitrificans TaxID=1968433 RepID=A0A254TEX5_9BURK|nr:hypothetical protein AYR66_17990 [Noviherbaspirillum denitrificans]
MLFDGEVMQLVAAPRIVAPCLPGSEEIQAEAETGLDDREAFPAAPAFRQPVPAQENMARLFQAAVIRVVDVAVGPGVGNAVYEGKRGGLETMSGHGKGVGW